MWYGAAITRFESDGYALARLKLLRLYSLVTIQLKVAYSEQVQTPHMYCWEPQSTTWYEELTLMRCQTACYPPIDRRCSEGLLVEAYLHTSPLLFVRLPTQINYPQIGIFCPTIVGASNIKWFWHWWWLIMCHQHKIVSQHWTWHYNRGQNLTRYSSGTNLPSIRPLWSHDSWFLNPITPLIRVYKMSW